MRSRLAGWRLAALCVLAVTGLSVTVSACSMPWTSSDSETGSAAAINQAIDQLQSTLGLADGAITRSSQSPMLASSEVALRWVGGVADVDLDTGRIAAILIAPPREDAGAITGEEPETAAAPSATDLDKEAKRVIGLLGWDTASLETHGFIAGEGETVDYNQVGTVYEKTWTGHDPEGVPNQGMLQVGLRAEDGSLHSYLYSPGPETPLDMAETITKDQAIKTAQAAAAKSAFLVSTTTTAPPTTTIVEGEQKPTTTTTTKKAAATTTTTVPPVATLVHTDDPGITGGGDMLVWVVELPAEQATGRASAIVYVDAVENEALLVTAR